MFMKLLLHSCCAPCSGAIIESLAKEGIRPVVFFSNSNIESREEYDKRLAELQRYCALFDIELVDDIYDHEGWLSYIKGLENEPERGGRCLKCFEYRLRRAADFAARRGLDTLTTSLASSRWKSLEQVDKAGAAACTGYPSVEWWGRNWRKGGLQERRTEIVREQNFYNQDFCGCEFSHRNSD